MKKSTKAFYVTKQWKGFLVNNYFVSLLFQSSQYINTCKIFTKPLNLINRKKSTLFFNFKFLQKW